MYHQVLSLLGKRIDDPAMQTFINSNGYKYPKKPYISNRASDYSYWLENKKQGVDLLFDIQVYNPKYPPLQADKKGVFAPILKEARWHNNKSCTVFPFAVGFAESFESLTAKLGTPTIKSSDIHPVWLNEDGSESFYRWKKPAGNSPDALFLLQFDDDQKVRDISASLNSGNKLLLLYNVLQYQTYDSFVAGTGYQKTQELMFLQWALDRGLMNSAATDALDYIKKLDRGYILQSDFELEANFVNKYLMNLSGHDVLYNRDFAHRFLTADLRTSYTSAAATAELDQLEFNQNNYSLVKAMIDQRLMEFKEHGFKKSAVSIQH